MSTKDEGAYFAERLERAPFVRWSKFRPFKLVFEMRSPVCLTHPWIALDGLIAHLMLLEGLGEDFFITPKKRDLSSYWPKNRRYLPLKRTGNVYHASVSQFEPNVLRVTNIYKRFEESRTESVRQKKIRVGQGYFRSYILKEPYVPAKRVTFYAFGDMRYIARLIGDYLIGLGNDTRIGFGTVRAWRIEDTPEDWSLVKDDVAMRPIPVEMCDEWEDEVLLAYKAPYWNPKNVKSCVPPGARCRLKDGIGTVEAGTA